MDGDLKLLLDEWKAMSAAATPGPWDYHAFGRGGDPEPTTIAIHTGDFDWDDLASGDSETAVAWMSDADSHQMYDGAAFIAASRTIVPRLIAAVEAVLEEHRPVEVEPSDTICGECSFRLPNGRYFGKIVEFPCPTVAAIRAALIGES